MLSHAYFNLKQYEKAVEWSQKAVRQPNAPYMPFAIATAILGYLDRIDEAGAMLIEVKKRNANFSADTIRNTIGLYGRYSGADRLIEGLKKAGLTR